MTERWREDHGHDERERVGPGDLWRRPAELGLHRHEEDGEGVVEDAPGDRLGDGKRPDDRPAVKFGLAARAPHGADHAPPALSRKVSTSPSALVATSQRPGAKRPGTPARANNAAGSRSSALRLPGSRRTPSPPRLAASSRSMSSGTQAGMLVSVSSTRSSFPPGAERTSRVERSLLKMLFVIRANSSMPCGPT